MLEGDRQKRSVSAVSQSRTSHWEARAEEPLCALSSSIPGTGTAIAAFSKYETKTVVTRNAPPDSGLHLAPPPRRRSCSALQTTVPLRYHVRIVYQVYRINAEDIIPVSTPDLSPFGDTG